MSIIPDKFKELKEELATPPRRGDDKVVPNLKSSIATCSPSFFVPTHGGTTGTGFISRCTNRYRQPRVDTRGEPIQLTPHAINRAPPLARVCSDPNPHHSR